MTDAALAETPKREWTNADIDREIGPSQQRLSAEDLYHSLFPKKLWTDADIDMLIALAEEVGGFKGITYGAERLTAAWEWNQAHKKGKYKLFCLAELATALRSTNDRCLLSQMDADSGCKLCEDATEGMDTPPVSAAPPTPTLSLCPHGNAWGSSCQPCADAKRNRCQHGNPSATCHQCSHPDNAVCRWRECGKWFHAPVRSQVYCSQECLDKSFAREAELKAKYAPQKPENQLAAFLEGRY
jgi:hypothetical protein